MARLLDLIRRGLQSFFAWWFGELASLVPARLNPARRRERHRLVLALDERGIGVSEIVGSRERKLGDVARAGPGQAAQIAGLLRKAQRRASRITLRLAPGMGLRKALDLPLAAQDDLEQLLRFEMDRLTPFRAEDVVFAQRVLDRDLEQQRIRVELQVAPRVVVEQALAVAAACKVRPTRVELARLESSGPDPDPSGVPALNLLPAVSEAAPASRLNRWLALIALLLTAAALAIPLQQQRLTAADLERQIPAAKAAAQQSAQLRDRLDQLDANIRFLGDQKRRIPMLTHVLAELTRVIPDQAYVEQLNVRDGELNLRGLATTPSDLIALLDRSTLFDKPQFRAPVTQDPRLGLERFQLSAKVAGEAR
jgi:general secretion pathway protein L